MGVQLGNVTFPQASLLEKEGVHIQKGPCLSGQSPRAVGQGTRDSLELDPYIELLIAILPFPSPAEVRRPFSSGLRVWLDVWGAGGYAFSLTHLCLSQWAQMNLLLPNNLILLPHGSVPSCDTHISHCL